MPLQAGSYGLILDSDSGGAMPHLAEVGARLRPVIGRFRYETGDYLALFLQLAAVCRLILLRPVDLERCPSPRRASSNHARLLLLGGLATVHPTDVCQGRPRHEPAVHHDPRMRQC